MRLIAAVLVLLLAASGCVRPDPNPSEAEHGFGGSFKESATQADITDFQQRMKAHGGDAVIMESFPPQFRVDNFGITGCTQAREEARTLRYVASTSECRAVVHATDDPDSATSTRAR